MKRLTTWTVALCLPLVIPIPTASEESDRRLTAEELVEASIRHHDPEGVWADARLVFDLQETRPDGTVRVSRLEIDNGSGAFRISGRHEVGGEGGKLSVSIGDGTCEFAVDGREPTAAEIESRRLDCDRWISTRNYYLYLWGMPMKLRDAGTRIEREVERTEFLGKSVDTIRVTYDEEVGSDIWYFYFDPGTHRLAGYRFHHEEAANDGEYIVGAGETRAGSLSLLRDLSWFVNYDDRFLGKDTLAGAMLVR